MALSFPLFFRLALFDPLDDSVPEQIVGDPWVDCPEQRLKAQAFVDKFNAEQAKRSGSFLLMRIVECNRNCFANECDLCRERICRLSKRFETSPSS